MKSISFTVGAILLLQLLAPLHAQTLLKYGEASVSKLDFVKAFSKNNNDRNPSEKTFRDYLELYIRFKLKVKAAYDHKLDTLPSQKAELAEFRNQIIDAYLHDDSSFQHMVKEAFARGQKDINLAHIYVPVKRPDSFNGTDTLKARQLAAGAYKQLLNGSDFYEVAGLYSSDPSFKLNKGNIGYITLFSLPYDLESLAYSTPGGKFSSPYRSRGGYHIFKNLGERKAVGKIKVAQILFAFPPAISDIQRAAIKQTADSVYDALVQGASFTQMVLQYSKDNESFKDEGELPVFGVGKYDPAFETSVFSLKENGDISRPFLTAYGYHIVKRIAHFPVDVSGNDSSMAVLKHDVRNDARMEIARQELLKKLFRISNFKNASVRENLLRAYTDNILNGKNVSAKHGISPNTILFTFFRKNVYVKDLVEFLRSAKGASIPGTPEPFNESLKRFKEVSVMKYYRDNLEKYNQEFSTQVNEFRDGNLLFEIMQQEIWNRAAADSSGQRRYYESHKDNYWWEPGADAIIFSCEDPAVCTRVRSDMEKNPDWRSVIRPFENRVRADSGRFELGQLQFEEKFLEPGKLSPPVNSMTEKSSTSFTKIMRVYREKSPRNFADARGFVLNDYQNSLEEEWVRALKAKYPVTVNEPVFRTLWE